MIKWLSVLVSLTLFFFVSAQQNALLWKINKKKHQTSYLFGTIHSQDARILDFAEQVLPYIETQDAYAGEIILQPQDALAILPYLFEKDSAKQSKHVFSEEEYKLLEERFAEQLGKEMLLILPRMSPYIAGMLLSLPPTETVEVGFNFLDISLQEYAEEQGLELISLESIASQMAYLQNIEVQKQKDFVLKLLESADNPEDELEEMIATYLNQDVDAMLQKLESSLGEDPLFSEEFMTERNQLQFDGMVEAMKTKKTFTAVGAAHLPGKDGLIQLLQDAGFKVTPIPLESLNN